MNTRNINFKTAASESSETRGTGDKLTDEILVQLYDFCELYGVGVRPEEVKSQVRERFSFCIDDVHQEIWLTATQIIAVDCLTSNARAISVTEGKKS